MNPSPRTRAQIGLAEQALGSWVDADADLREAMKKEDDPWIAKNRRVIEQGLEEIANHLGMLMVDTGGRPAELWLDGAFVVTLPHDAAKVAAGGHRIELRTEGHPALQRTLDVPAKTTLILQIELGADRSRAPTPAPSPLPIGAAKPESKSAARIAAWSTATVGGVFLAEAVIAQIMRESLLGKYNDDALCGPTPIVSRSERCGHYLHDAETAQTMAVVGFVAAGAAALTSASLFVFVVPSNRASASNYRGPPMGIGWRSQF